MRCELLPQFPSQGEWKLGQYLAFVAKWVRRYYVPPLPCSEVFINYRERGRAPDLWRKRLCCKRVPCSNLSSVLLFFSVIIMYFFCVVILYLVIRKVYLDIMKCYVVFKCMHCSHNSQHCHIAHIAHVCTVTQNEAPPPPRHEIVLQGENTITYWWTFLVRCRELLIAPGVNYSRWLGANRRRLFQNSSILPRRRFPANVDPIPS